MTFSYGDVQGLSESDMLLAQALQAKGSDLVPFAQAPDKVRRLTFGLGMGMEMSWDEALDLFKRVLATFGKDASAEWATWREDAVSK